METFLKYLLDESVLLTEFRKKFSLTDQFDKSRHYGKWNPSAQLVNYNTAAQIGYLGRSEHRYARLGLAKIFKIFIDKHPESFDSVGVEQLSNPVRGEYKEYRVSINLRNVPGHVDRDNIYRRAFNNWFYSNGNSRPINLSELSRELGMREKNIGIFFLDVNRTDLYYEDKQPTIRKRILPLSVRDIVSGLEKTRDRAASAANYPLGVCRYSIVSKSELGIDDEDENAEDGDTAYVVAPLAVLDVTLKSINKELDSKIYSTKQLLGIMGFHNPSGDSKNKNWIYLNSKNFARINPDNIDFGSDNDNLFYKHLIRTIQNGKVPSFNLSTLMRDKKFKLMLMAKGNPVRVILSEVLIPFLLAAGYTSIDGNPIISDDGSLKDYEVDSVRFPDDNSNFLSDFGIVWVKVKNKDDKKDIFISAKIGKDGHTPSLFSFLRRIENFPVFLRDNSDAAKEMYFLFSALNRNSINTKILNEKMMKLVILRHAAIAKDRGIESTVKDKATYADYLNRLPGFLDLLYELIFCFYDKQNENVEFRQMEMDVETDEKGVTLVFNTIRHRADNTSINGKISIKPGDNNNPLGIKLKRMPV